MSYEASLQRLAVVAAQRRREREEARSGLRHEAIEAEAAQEENWMKTGIAGGQAGQAIGSMGGPMGGAWGTLIGGIIGTAIGQAKAIGHRLERRGEKATLGNILESLAKVNVDFKHNYTLDNLGRAIPMVGGVMSSAKAGKEATGGGGDFRPGSRYDPDFDKDYRSSDYTYGEKYPPLDPEIQQHGEDFQYSDPDKNLELTDPTTKPFRYGRK